MKNNHYQIDEAVILCGGKGTRLRSIVHEFPKSLAPVGTKVFLDLLVESLIEQKIKKIIFSVGYMKEKIIKRYSGLKEIQVFFSEEEAPLGTGGAVKNSVQYVSKNFFLVINGDSYIDILYKDLIKNIKMEKADALVLVKKNNSSRSDVGLFEISKNHKKIIGFSELNINDINKYINCGVYILNKKCFENEELDEFSLESYFLPKIIQKSFVTPFLSESSLYDIGTPDRYSQFLKKYE